MEVVAPDVARMGVAAIEILAVVGHVAQVVVRVGNLGDVEFLDEVAFGVVFVEHRKHGCRLAPCGGVDVLTVEGHGVLAAGGAGEGGHEVPHVAGVLFLSLHGPWRNYGQKEQK